MKTVLRQFKHCLTICLISLSASFVLIANASADDETVSLQASIGFVNVNAYPVLAGKINPIRLKALRETAIHLGATGALAYRSLQINASLEKEGTALDHVFDFNRILLPHNVLPPVIVQSDNSLNLDNSETIRGDAKSYKIASPARFVTTAPTWRTYLYMNYAKPTLPDHTLLPTSQAEASAWNLYLKQGWQQGIDQANAIFSENLNRLKRDYGGMIIFRKLLAQHMASAPYVAQSNLGITGNQNEIRIGDKITRITNPAKLQINSRKWTPVPILSNG